MIRYCRLCVMILVSSTAAGPVFGQALPASRLMAAVNVQPPPKPRNYGRVRKIESTITKVTTADNKVTITLRSGDISIGLTPTTELVQEERGLVASDLKVNDGICLVTFKSSWEGKINGKAVVTDVDPLALKLEELGTLTLNKPELITFSRYQTIQVNALAIGQTVAVELRPNRDGEIETKRVAVIIATKPIRTTKSRATPK